MGLTTELCIIHKSGLATSRITDHGIAATAAYDSLGMRKDGADVEAGVTLDVHEEAVWALDETLLLVATLLGGS